MLLNQVFDIFFLQKKVFKKRSSHSALECVSFSNMRCFLRKLTDILGGESSETSLLWSVAGRLPLTLEAAQ